jgi:hypothetical protein
MEHLRNRHYYSFLTVAFLCIIAVMTSLGIVAVFAGAFPERLHAFLKGSKWIVLIFYFAPILLNFGLAYFSARFIDLAFNLFFHRRNVITNHAGIRLLNIPWELGLIGSFMIFALGLLFAMECAVKSFYWRQQQHINFSNLLMAGAILAYIIALWSACQLFIPAVSVYISTKYIVQSQGSDIQPDPTVWESSNNGTINADEDGLSINDRYGNGFLEWKQIQEVRPYKREDAVIGVVFGLNILSEEGLWWKIRDNMVGYHDMQSWLPRKLPGFDESWSEKFPNSKFRIKRSILWKRSC